MIDLDNTLEFFVKVSEKTKKMRIPHMLGYASTWIFPNTYRKVSIFLGKMKSGSN